jgi:hypothetical protein
MRLAGCFLSGLWCCGVFELFAHCQPADMTVTWQLTRPKVFVGSWHNIIRDGCLMLSRIRIRSCDLITGFQAADGIKDEAVINSVIKTNAMNSCKMLFKVLAVRLVARPTVRSGTEGADAPATGSHPCCWPLKTINLCLLVILQKRNGSACCCPTSVASASTASSTAQCMHSLLSLVGRHPIFQCSSRQIGGS